MAAEDLKNLKNTYTIIITISVTPAERDSAVYSGLNFSAFKHQWFFSRADKKLTSFPRCQEERPWKRGNR